MDLHHKFWPRSEYKTGVEKAFRQLGENVVQICRAEHDLEHAVSDPPDKPDREIMLMAIQEQRNRRSNGMS
jgi:hypothetical protein